MNLETRPFQPGDEVALQAAMRELEVSLSKGHAAHPAAPGYLMRPVGQVPSLERLRWMHMDNPGGSRSLLLWDGTRVVGHFSAVPQKVWLDGHKVVFGELSQCFCLPEYRQSLVHRTPFVGLAESFFETHGGMEGDLLFYGLPSYGEWRIGKKCLDYESLRLQALLACEVGSGATELPAGVESFERFDHQARWLWDRCAGEFGALGIRDEAFLNWRFADNPDQDYQCLGVRDDEGVLRGYAVYAMAKWQGERRALVVDWLCPEGEPEVAAQLHEGLLTLARKDGQRSLATLIPERSSWHSRFQDWGYHVLPAETFIFGRVFQRRFNILWLRDNWWYTLADLLAV